MGLLMNKFFNYLNNNPIDGEWHKNSIVINGVKKTFQDVDSIAFTLTQSKEYFNTIKRYDKHGYFISIDNLYFGLRHSLFKAF